MRLAAEKDEDEHYRAVFEEYKAQILNAVKAGNTEEVAKVTDKFNESLAGKLLYMRVTRIDDYVRVAATDTPGKMTTLINKPFGDRRIGLPNIHYAFSPKPHVTRQTDDGRTYILIETNRLEGGRYADDVFITMALEPAPPATQPAAVPGDMADASTSITASEVADYHRRLTGEDLPDEALKKHYTDQAMRLAQTGGDPYELGAAVHRALAFGQDEATLVQLQIYLGDAYWRQTAKYTPEVWRPQRLKAAQAYLDGLAIVVQHELPAEPPELPAVNKGDVDRQQHAQEMAARKQAERVRQWVQFRQVLTGQIVQMYARQPDDFDQLHQLVLNHFGSQEVAAALVAGAKAYRADSHAAPVVLALPAAWGKAVKGLQAGLRFGLQNRAYRMGERVDFALLVRNTGVKAVTVVDWVPLAGWAPTVRGIDGKSLPVAVPPFDGPVQMRKSVLKPGDILEVGTVFLQIDAEAEARGDWPHVHLTPGKYGVSQSYRFGDNEEATWSGELTTGELTLSVAAADGPI